MVFQGAIAFKETDVMKLRILWIIFGLIDGFFAGTIVGKFSRKGLFNVVLAIISGLVCGWLFGFFNYASSTGVVDFGERNILIDVIGSVILLVIFQALTKSAE